MEQNPPTSDPRFQEFGHTLATRGAGETTALGVKLTVHTGNLLYVNHVIFDVQLVSHLVS